MHSPELNDGLGGDQLGSRNEAVGLGATSYRQYGGFLRWRRFDVSKQSPADAGIEGADHWDSAHAGTVPRDKKRHRRNLHVSTSITAEFFFPLRRSHSFTFPSLPPVASNCWSTLYDRSDVTPVWVSAATTDTRARPAASNTRRESSEEIAANDPGDAGAIE